MNLEKLSDDGKIAKVEKKELDLAIAERDLSAAKDNLDSGNHEWALSIAYNAVLQSSRALMFSMGFRPKGKEQHKTVFEFLRETEMDEDMIDYFDVVRKKRHIAVYDVADYVPETTATETVDKAKEFVQKIRTENKNQIHKRE